jgi:hypothetical protein
MNLEMKTAVEEIAQLVEGSPVTKGICIRVRGKILTLSRSCSTHDGETAADDRVRLTHLGGGTFGLSVMRHTGKWEKAPFMGSVAELFEVISGPMQHLVADWP